MIKKADVLVYVPAPGDEYLIDPTGQSYNIKLTYEKEYPVCDVGLSRYPRVDRDGTIIKQSISIIDDVGTKAWLGTKNVEKRFMTKASYERMKKLEEIC